MSLVNKLQRLIQTDGEIAGRVISVSDTSVVVATASGQIEISANKGLHTGDLVTIDAGIAIKKQRGGDATVYLV
jgi:hypothetical protein